MRNNQILDQIRFFGVIIIRLNANWLNSQIKLGSNKEFQYWYMSRFLQWVGSVHFFFWILICILYKFCISPASISFGHVQVNYTENENNNNDDEDDDDDDHDAFQHLFTYFKNITEKPNGIYLLTKHLSCLCPCMWPCVRGIQGDSLPSVVHWNFFFFVVVILCIVRSINMLLYIYIYYANTWYIRCAVLILYSLHTWTIHSVCHFVV